MPIQETMLLNYHRLELVPNCQKPNSETKTAKNLNFGVWGKSSDQMQPKSLSSFKSLTFIQRKSEYQVCER